MLGSDQLHVMVADVVMSFDTVDRSILDCVCPWSSWFAPLVSGR